MLPLDGALVTGAMVVGPFVTGAFVGASVFGVGGKVTVVGYENQNCICIGSLSANKMRGLFVKFKIKYSDQG